MKRKLYSIILLGALCSCFYGCGTEVNLEDQMISDVENALTEESGITDETPEIIPSEYGAGLMLTHNGKSIDITSGHSTNIYKRMGLEENEYSLSYSDKEYRFDAYDTEYFSISNYYLNEEKTEVCFGDIYIDYVSNYNETEVLGINKDSTYNDFITKFGEPDEEYGSSDNYYAKIIEVNNVSFMVSGEFDNNKLNYYSITLNIMPDEIMDNIEFLKENNMLIPFGDV